VESISKVEIFVFLTRYYSACTVTRPEKGGARQKGAKKVLGGKQGGKLREKSIQNISAFYQMSLHQMVIAQEAETRPKGKLVRERKKEAIRKLGEDGLALGKLCQRLCQRGNQTGYKARCECFFASKPAFPCKGV
jgi:hypothetical protein